MKATVVTQKPCAAPESVLSWALWEPEKLRIDASSAQDSKRSSQTYPQNLRSSSALAASVLDDRAVGLVGLPVCAACHGSPLMHQHYISWLRLFFWVAHLSSLSLQMHQPEHPIALGQFLAFVFSCRRGQNQWLPQVFHL
jgi:hypothetical protein